MEILFECSDNSNMAANLQDGRLRLPGNAMICFDKRQQIVKKDNLVKLIMLSSRRQI